MTDSDVTTCPRCGVPLLVDGPADSCRRCLMSGAPDVETSAPPVSSPSRAGARRKLALASALATIFGGPWIGNRWLQEGEDAHTHRELGLILNKQGKFEDALAAYRTAIRLRPDDAPAHLNPASPWVYRASWRRGSPS